MTPQELDAYERKHGVLPPGMRGTGPAWWFGAKHPTIGTCACGVETDRWIVINLRIGRTPGHTPDLKVGQHMQGLIGDFVPQCDACQELECIQKAQRTLGQPGISEKTKAECVTYLATIHPSRAA